MGLVSPIVSCGCTTKRPPPRSVIRPAETIVDDAVEDFGAVLETVPAAARALLRIVARRLAEPTRSGL
jgi:hypothetical protein